MSSIWLCSDSVGDLTKAGEEDAKPNQSQHLPCLQSGNDCTLQCHMSMKIFGDFFADDVVDVWSC